MNESGDVLYNSQLMLVTYTWLSQWPWKKVKLYCVIQLILEV